MPKMIRLNPNILRKFVTKKSSILNRTKIIQKWLPIILLVLAGLTIFITEPGMGDP